MATLAGPDIVHVARAETRRILALELSVGARLPASHTSMGRVLRARAPPPVLDVVLAAPRTVTDEAALPALLDRVRAGCVAIVNGELELGLRSLAVPVVLEDAIVPAAVNVSTLAARTKLGELRRRMPPVLREAAGAIAPMFGG